LEVCHLFLYSLWFLLLDFEGLSCFFHFWVECLKFYKSKFKVFVLFFKRFIVCVFCFFNLGIWFSIANFVIFLVIWIFKIRFFILIVCMNNCFLWIYSKFWFFILFISRIEKTSKSTYTSMKTAKLIHLICMCLWKKGKIELVRRKFAKDCPLGMKHPETYWSLTARPVKFWL